MTQLDMIIKAIENLGGTGCYSEIYKEIERLNGNLLTPGRKAGIRKAIEDHSSDSENYKRGYDWFYSVKGLGKGVWGLRSLSNNDSLLNLLIKYDCHLNRGSESMEEFLRKHFRNYLEDLRTSIKSEDNQLVGEEMCQMVSEKIDEIEENANNLIEVFSLYNKGKIIPASIKAFEIFDGMKYQLIRRYSAAYIKERYFRIRKIDDKSLPLERKELFHIPYSMNHLVGTARYSMPGHPCLYLASQAKLCWYECGKPEHFAIAKFDIPQDESSCLKFIDFSEKTIPLRQHFISWFHQKEELDSLRKYFLKHIYTYPLRAACSVAVEHKGSPFIEEYIIPQMLLQWVLKDEDFDGIKYESCSSSEEVRTLCAHNIVLVTKEFDKNGFDIKLRSCIGVGEPEVIRLLQGIERISSDFQKI